GRLGRTAGCAEPVLAAEARVAVSRSGTLHRTIHTLDAEVSEAVGADVIRDLLDGVLRCNQLVLRRRIDPVVTRPGSGRRAYAEVYFLRSGGPKHLHELLACRSPHNRIVDDDHTLAREAFAVRVELDLHAEVTDRLFRLDERAADIVITDQ